MQYRWQEVNKTETQYCPIDINDYVDADLENCEDQAYSNDNYDIDNFDYTYTLYTCLLNSEHTEESLLTNYHVFWKY
jgi:hypothetical protein